MDNQEPAPRKKGKVVRFIIVLAAIGLLYNMVTGNSGGGIYNPKYRDGKAVIKVDNYVFNEDSDSEWWDLCDKIIEASKRKGVEEIYLEIHVVWIDEYGKETKEVFDARMDDPRVRPIEEIRKFQSGQSLFDRYGMGFVAAFMLAVRN